MEIKLGGRFSNLVKRLFLISFIILVTLSWAEAQGLKPIKLDAPDKKRGLPFMETLSIRASVHEWSDKELSIKDLSDMLWAAHGVNRPDGKRTAPSARDSHDIDVYVFMKKGVYLYDANNHVLNPVVSGDHRENLGKPAWFAAPPDGAVPPAGGTAPDQSGVPPAGNAAPAGPTGNASGESGGVATPPTLLFLVSDISRFDGDGTTENKVEWATIDAGIVSQNVSLFCAATGLKTRPRASFGKDHIKKLLNLKDTQYPLLNMPVGYAAD